MPHNVMVKYVGPMRQIYVPFPEDGSFPLKSMSDMHDVVTFPRGQMVELSPERAEVLLAQSPGVFKHEGTIRAAQAKKDTKDVKGNQDSVREDSEPADDHV